MDLESALKEYKQAWAIKPGKEDMKKAMEAATEAGWGAFMEREEMQMLSYSGFLRMQLWVMKKRWWLLQLLVLAGIWLLYPAMEVEAAAYYSLKQVYAARMLLFGIADVLMLTVFIAGASMTMKFALTELLIQFLFPMTVTACICFGFLCGEKYFSGSAAAGLCLIWSVVWWLVLLNERIYAVITMPVWAGLFALALGFFIFSLVRSMKNCEKLWEAKADGIEIE